MNTKKRVVFIVSVIVFLINGISPAVAQFGGESLVSTSYPVSPGTELHAMNNENTPTKDDIRINSDLPSRIKRASGVAEAVNIFPGGDGTVENPYHISTVEELQAVKDFPDKHFILVNDIDASATSSWNEGAGFEPIEVYTGSLNGNGHKISGLFISRISADGVGLFTKIAGGSVSNIALVNVNITGKNNVGGIAGLADNGANISGSYISGKVSGEGNVGGFLGLAFSLGGNVTITNSYSIVKVSGSSIVGGLVATMTFGGAISDSYTSASVENGYGLVDTIDGATITNSFWNSDSVSTVNGVGTGKTTSEMRHATTFNGFDFTNTWAIDEGLSYPYLKNNEQNPRPGFPFPNGSGTEGDPYEISTLEQLQAMKYLLGKHFILTGNIDASATSSWNSGAGFEPIGNSSTQFTGSFNGQAHVISGLYINRGGTDYVGLFGAIGLGGSVKNIGLESAGIIGNNYTGGLVGRNFSIVSGSYVTGMITGGASVGGLVGQSAGNVLNSYATGKVSGSASIGGLVGLIESGIVSKSYASGKISGTSASVGGLVGTNYGNITGSFWNSDSISTDRGGIGKTTAELKTLATFIDAGWDFDAETSNGTDNTWDMDNVNGTVRGGYPFLAWENGASTGVVFNTAPTLSSFSSAVVNSNEDAEAEITLAAMKAAGDEADNDGTVDAFVVQGIASGSLKIGADSSSATAYNAVTNNTIDASNGAYWTPDANDRGTISAFTVKAKDNSGALSSTAVDVTVEVTAVNDDPVLTGLASSPVTVTEDAGTQYLSDVLSNATFDDADAGGNNVELYLSLGSGTFSLADPDGLISIAGDGSSESTLTGSADHIEIYLNKNTNIGYTPGSNVYGPRADTLVISANDKGHTGSGGGSTVILGTVYIDITAVNDAPVATGVTVSGSLKVGETLTGSYSYSDPENDSESGSTYAWYRSDDTSGSEKQAISGATNSTYTLTADDLGKYLSYQVTPSDGADAGSAVESSLRGPVAALFAAGDGTSGDPYQIATLEQLQAVKDYLDKHFILVNDIDASDTRNWNSGAGFEPLGDESELFTGFLDGNGHVITGLFINRGSYAGLFGFIGNSGIVINVGLKAVDLTANATAGGLAGENRGSITASFVTGRVNGTTNTGGLVGRNTGTISESYSKAKVRGNSNTGGLSGSNSGSVSGSFVTGGVLGITNTGGIIGYSPGSGTVTSSFWENDSVHTDNGFGTGKSPAELKTLATYIDAGWDFDGETSNGTDNTWDMDNINGTVRGGYPFLAWENGNTTAVIFNTAPETDLNGSVAGTEHTVSYTEKKSQVKIAPMATVTDVDGGNLSSMIVTLTNKMDEDENLYLTDAGFTIVFGMSYTIRGNGIIEIESPSSITNFQNILREIIYYNNSDNPNTTDRIITVVVNDGYENSVSHTVTVKLNLPPSFTSATTANFTENDTGTAYTVTASDSETLTYSLGSGNDEGLFDINSSTGVITFKDAPDFENPTDSNTDNVYTINVIASDGTHSVNQDVTITVSNVNEKPAVGNISISGGVVIGDTLTGSYTFSDPENDTESASTFKWYRFDDATGTGKQAISGATGSTYILRVNDLGKYLSFEVIPNDGTNAGAAMESALTGPVDDPFAGGDGTSGDPYQISTLDQLQAMKYFLTSHFILLNDIDASATSGWNPDGSGGYYGFEPIGTLSGSFNGDGYLISSLYINRRSSDRIGLFSDIGSSGTIKNLGLESVSIKGKNVVGGIAGRNYGSVLKSYVTGVINGTTNIGGLIGQNSGNITASYTAGKVSGSYAIGGLVGINASGLVSVSYANGKVSGINTVGGLVGQNDDSISNSFWNSDSVSTDNGAGTGKTTAEMKALSTYINAGWDFHGEAANGTDDTWDIDNVNASLRNGYPFLAWENGDGTSINYPPFFTFVAGVIAVTDEDTEVEITFAQIAAQADEKDSDGSVIAFVVQAVNSGTLRINGSPFSSGTNDEITDLKTAVWTPDVNANGVLNAFTILAKDNKGLISRQGHVQTQIKVNAVDDNLEVLSTTPQAGAGKIPVDISSLEITYSVDIIIADTSGIYLTHSGGTPVEREITVDGKRLLLSAELIHATTYTVTVDSGAVKSKEGIAGGGYSFNFTTIMEHPQIISVIPADESILVSAVDALEITFNQEISLADTSAISVKYSEGESIYFTPVVSGKKLTLEHEPFIYSSTVVVMLATGAILNADSLSTADTSWTFTVMPESPEVPQLLSPEDHTTASEISLMLTWSSSANTDFYMLEVAADENFSDLLISEENLADTTYQLNNLNYSTTYWWRVRAKNTGASSEWSEIYAFSTMQAEVISVANKLGRRTVVEDFSAFTAANLDTVFTVTGDLNLTYAISSDTVLAEIRVDGGMLLAEPKRNAFGEMNITVTASDGEEHSVSDVLNLTILPVNDAPVINLGTDSTYTAMVSEFNLPYGEIISDAEDSLDELIITVSVASELVTAAVDTEQQRITVLRNGFTGVLPIDISVSDSEGETTKVTLEVEFLKVSINDIKGLEVGKQVTVTGIVTSPRVGPQSAYYVQFESSGIKVLLTAAKVVDGITDLKAGMEIEVTGTIDSLDGAFVLSNSVAALLSEDNPLPEPVKLTSMEQWSVDSDLAGSRITLENVSLVDASQWPVSPLSNEDSVIVMVKGNLEQLSGTFAIYIAAGSELVGTAAPEGAFNITGVLDISGEQVKLIPFMISDKEVATANEEENLGIPSAYKLNNNYPNPFNPTTTISYEVPEAARIKLEIFNITGQRVATLVNEIKPAGRYQIHFDADGLSSGIYLVRMVTPAYTSTSKMTLVK